MPVSLVLPRFFGTMPRMDSATIHTSPATARRILSYHQDNPTGYYASLSCGHTVWMSVDPADFTTTHCGQCLNEFVNRHRERQSVLAQQPDGTEDTLP